ncbi:MAG: hypothetical protein N3J91_02960 [Verrucomicrobiae bacterium]|nr:hypothetical protein [Verrucomicrobiae bacterium]
MKHTFGLHAGMLFLSLTLTLAAAPLGSAFLYQGRLTQQGQPAQGLYDLTFTLFDTPSGGAPLAGPITNLQVSVSNGLFSAEVDFGPAPFNGTALWLAVAVRPAGGGAFTPLTPRQPLLPAPYATFAANAAVAQALTANAVNTASLKDGAVTLTKIATNQIVTSLNGLRDAVQLSGTNGITINPRGNTLVISGPGPGGPAWALTGNAGTLPGSHFLGTADNQPLELRVNNTRFLLAQPTTGVPNLIGGDAANLAFPGTLGAVIAGGGQGAEANAVGGAFAFVGAGRYNLVHSNANESAVVAGYGNVVYTNTWSAFIGGGTGNWIDSFSHFAVVAGGEENYVNTNSQHAVIGGGNFNTIGTEAPAGWIGGGAYNSLLAGAASSSIGGGRYNTISQDAAGSFIGGGLYNTNRGNISVIAGGFSNLVDTLAYGATVGGGELNYIGNSDDATIAGGYYNYVDDNAHFGTVGGGADNWVQPGAAYATIPGGAQAAALSYGQLAYASGMDNSWGDAQSSLYVLRRTTTNAATLELFLDGRTQRMLVPTNGTWSFQIMIAARNNAGGSAGFRLEGVIKNVAGTVSLVGTPSVTALGSDITGIPNPQVAADNTNKALILRVTGLAGQRIKWVARVQTTELKF